MSRDGQWRLEVIVFVDFFPIARDPERREQLTSVSCFNNITVNLPRLADAECNDSYSPGNSSLIIPFCPRTPTCDYQASTTKLTTN